MGWASIIAALLSTFGPLLSEWVSKWLENLLKKSAALIPAPGAIGSPTGGMTMLFDTAISSTPRVAFARRALLRRLKASAVEHAPALLKTGAVDLSHVEVEELRDAAGAADAE